MIAAPCWTRSALLSLLSSAAVAVTIPAVAQIANPNPGASSAPREMIVGGQSPPAIQRCIEVDIGGDQVFGCLNQQLKREVDRINPVFNAPPIDARSPDVRVGNVNQAAVIQQYGANYGRSVIPFRPPPAVFVPHR